MQKQSRLNAPPILKDFLNYIESVAGCTPKTADEYYLDLRLLFRFLLVEFGMASTDVPFDEISISKIDINFIKKIQLTDLYAFLSFLARDRETSHGSHYIKQGLSVTSRARKISAIRSFFKYLELKLRLISENPANELEYPKMRKSLVKYLTLEESINLLSNVNCRNSERDYTIITMFLNCGLRVSELCGINLEDISESILRVRGKGGKERVIYLNDAVIDALSRYIPIREKVKDVSASAQKALFISEQKNRINPRTVKWLVSNHCKKNGLDSKITAHKLRHTAATLMFKNGVDVRVLQEVLGHEHLNTTQIYTHVDDNDMRTATRANPLSKIKKED